MKAISEYQMTPGSTVREAIEIIDRGKAQIALVMQADGRLLGTVTDGDIRRALLRGKSFDTLIEHVMHREFRSLPASATEEDALTFMRRKSLHQMPALDEEGRVVRMFLLEELIRPKSLSNPVVIMAGGEGRRLRPLTEDCPKPMLRVGEKPLLEIILEQCIDAGFQEFYFAVNYLKDKIKDYFCDGAHWGVQIKYLEESQPLGTAGALSLLPEQPSEPMLVINGDVLTRVNYAQLLNFHHEHASAATICVREHTTQIPYGVVHMNDMDVFALEEKPIISHYVNAGIYLLDPKLLSLIPNECFFDMPQLLEHAVKLERQVCAFPIHEYWLDVGLPETLEQAHGEWK